MNKILLVFTYFILQGISVAQNTKIEYLNQHFYPCRKDSAIYYRKASFDQDGIYHGRMQTYFISGAIYSDIEYVHGVPDGEWEWWFENKKKSKEVVYDEGEYIIKNSWNREGKSMVQNGVGVDTNWYYNWNLENINRYVSGKSDSLQSWWHENGKLDQTYLYKNGEITMLNKWDEKGQQVITNGTGDYTDYYKNGKLRAKGKYVNGIRQGEWIWYHDNGKMSDKEFYKNNELDGKYESWYKNGKPRFVGYYEEGVKTDTAVWYLWNGIKVEEGKYDDGVYSLKNSWNLNGEPMVVNGTGPFEGFYMNGARRSKGWFEDGKKSGKWQWWYRNGKMEEEASFSEDGKLIITHYTMDGLADVQNSSGYAKYYYLGGGLHTEGKVVKGKKEGVWTWYYTNGTPNEVAEYSANKEVGSNIEWYWNGNKKFQKLINGNSVKKTWWYEDGKIQEEGITEDGEYSCENFYDRKGNKTVIDGNGTFIKSNRSGDPLAKGGYVNGKREGEWTWWYSNGNIEEICHYSKGILEGRCNWFNKNGIKTSEANYSEGKFDGEFTNYYENGNKKETGIYDQGNLKMMSMWTTDGKQTVFDGTGSFEQFHANGKLDVKGFYKDGKKSGEWTWYHEDGKLKEKANYEEGLLTGTRIFYNERGIKKKESNYVSGEAEGSLSYYNDKGIKTEEGVMKDGTYKLQNKWSDDGKQLIFNGTGVYEENYKSGNKKTRGHYNQTVRVGEWTWWYENGNKETESMYENGLLNGTVSFYYENGQKSSDEDYVKGIQKGNYITWYENGQKKEEGKYSSDDEYTILNKWSENGEVMVKQGDGKIKDYYSNGLRKVQGSYVNGKRDGTWTWWNEDGVAIEVCEYKEGKLNGIRTKYSEKGIKISEVTYVNGEQEGHYITYYFNGQSKEEGIYKQGKYNVQNIWNQSGKQTIKNGTGKYEYFNPSGTLLIYGNYKNGRKSGIWKWWFDDGKLKSTGKYKEGVTDGEWKWYYSEGGISQKGKYKEGKQNGLYSFYKPDGKMYLDEYYKEGDLDYSVLLYLQSGEPIYYYTQDPATPYRGFNNAYEYLRNIKFPYHKELDSDIFYIGFFVNKSGDVSNIELVNGSANKTAIKLSEEFINYDIGKWNPAKVNGKPVNVYYIWPFLIDTTKSKEKDFKIEISQNEKLIDTHENTAVVDRSPFTISVTFNNNNENELYVIATTDSTVYNKLNSGIPTFHVTGNVFNSMNPLEKNGPDLIFSSKKPFMWNYIDGMNSSYEEISLLSKGVKCIKTIDSISIAGSDINKVVNSTNTGSFKSLPETIYLIFYTKEKVSSDFYFYDYKKELFKLKFR